VVDVGQGRVKPLASVRPEFRADVYNSMQMSVGKGEGTEYNPQPWQLP
jgi:hypothetical protein